MRSYDKLERISAEKLQHRLFGVLKGSAPFGVAHKTGRVAGKGAVKLAEGLVLRLRDGVVPEDLPGLGGLQLRQVEGRVDGSDLLKAVHGGGDAAVGAVDDAIDDGGYGQPVKGEVNRLPQVGVEAGDALSVEAEALLRLANLTNNSQ